MDIYNWVNVAQKKIRFRRRRAKFREEIFRRYRCRLESLTAEGMDPEAAKKTVMEELGDPEMQGGMVQDRYGITAPDPEKSTRVDPKEIDAVIVPMVGFDKHNNRLGQGGGYYDRYLARCPGAKHIAVAFAEQEFDHIVTDYFDLPMDMVVTDK